MIFYDARNATISRRRAGVRHIDPLFHLGYRRNATPRLRQYIRSLSREGRPVRPSLALAVILVTAAAGFIA